MNSRLLGRRHLRKDHCRGCLAGNWFLGGRVGRRLVVPASPLKAITVTAATTKHTATFNIERTAPLKH